jgi:hypothetical protein
MRRRFAFKAGFGRGFKTPTSTLKAMPRKGLFAFSVEVGSSRGATTFTDLIPRGTFAYILWRWAGIMG